MRIFILRIVSLSLSRLIARKQLIPIYEYLFAISPSPLAIIIFLFRIPAFLRSLGRSINPRAAQIGTACPPRASGKVTGLKSIERERERERERGARGQTETRVLCSRKQLERGQRISGANSAGALARSDR